jgi:hypothetical protein
MKTSDKIKFRNIIEEEILKTHGLLSIIDIKRTENSKEPYETIKIHCINAYGQEFEETRHISCQLIYDTDFHTMAKSIASHMDLKECVL